MTRSELEDLRARLHDGIEQLEQLARSTNAGDRPTPEDLEHAKHYRAEAAKFRRRRANPRPGAGEDPIELEQRARYLEERAHYLETGTPVPRHLRTPTETLAAVDLLRRRLAAVLEHALYLEAEDVEAFQLALARKARVDALRGDPFKYISAALLLLGVHQADGGPIFAPFASPADGAITFTLKDGEPPQPAQGE